jgi:hypothetical protein
MKIFKVKRASTILFFSSKEDAYKYIAEDWSQKHSVIEEDFCESDYVFRKEICHYNSQNKLCKALFSPQNRNCPISTIIGQKILKIKISEDKCTILFYTDKSKFIMHHGQECCEDVHLEEVHGGDLTDLEGTIITSASEDICSNEEGTLTFYRFGNKDITLTIRWIGTSNGYYSENVSFTEIHPEFDINWYDEDGKYHNESGPAITTESESQWWIHGSRIDCKDNEEFLRIIKIKELL